MSRRREVFEKAIDALEAGRATIASLAIALNQQLDWSAEVEPMEEVQPWGEAESLTRALTSRAPEAADLLAGVLGSFGRLLEENAETPSRSSRS